MNRPTIGVDARKIHDYGIGRYLGGLLRGLATLEGPERYVLFVRSADLGRPPAALQSLLENERFRAVVCDAPLYSVREVFAFHGAAGEHDLDLLHFPHYVRGWGSGCPVAVTIHDPIHVVHPPSLLARLYARGMMTWSARSAALLFTDTRSVRDDLCRILSVESERFRVTYVGLDPLFTPPPPEEVEELRRARRLDGPLVLCVASHRPHKNLTAGVEAFRRASLEGATLVVPARDAQATRHLAPFRAIDRPFRILEDVSDRDLQRLYAAARIVLVPTVYEGFGLPELEAAACGGAVLTTDLPVHREVLGDAAAFARSGSAAHLAEALAALWSDESRRRELASRGPLRAAEFPWERTARLTLEGYRSATGSS